MSLLLTVWIYFNIKYTPRYIKILKSGLINCESSWLIRSPIRFADFITNCLIKKRIILTELNRIFQKDAQHTTGFFVNQTRDSPSACQPSNSGLRYSLDVISQNFAVPLSTTFTQDFSPFSSTSHVAASLKTKRRMMAVFGT
jgi:hypothetical protein